MDLLDSPTRRKHGNLFFLLWEVLRFGFIWTLTAGALNIDGSYATAVYLLYSMSPGLAVIAGFFLLWRNQDKEYHNLHAVLVMAKGFQIVFGSASAVLMMRSFGVHPMFYRGEFLYIAVITLADLAVCVMMILSRRKKLLELL